MSIDIPDEPDFLWKLSRRTTFEPQGEDASPMGRPCSNMSMDD